MNERNQEQQSGQRQSGQQQQQSGGPAGYGDRGQGGQAEQGNDGSKRDFPGSERQVEQEGFMDDDPSRVGGEPGGDAAQHEQGEASPSRQTGGSGSEDR